MPKIAYAALHIFLLVVSAVNAQTRQTKEAGIFYARYFSPREYKANPQNWSVVQKHNGVMVFGNGDGVMSFDGSHWQVTPIANSNLVRCVAMGADQKLYAGGYDEIGFISEPPIGKPSYVSLTSKLNGSEKEFGHVWNILVASNGVYFTTDKGILHYDGTFVKPIRLGISGDRLFTTLYKNQIWVQPADESLFRLEKGEPKPIPDGNFYKGKRITAVLPYDSHSDLICTLDDGVYLYDGVKNVAFAPEASDFLSENRLYKALLLDNGDYAFGTLNRGVLIVNADGHSEHLLEKGRGLGDNAVYNMYEDMQGGLWVCHSVGISRVELQTPITWFDERNGLSGAVNDVIRYENDVYAATMLGFYRLSRGNAANVPAHFEHVKEITSSVWAMTARHGSLLLATDNGTVELKNGKYRLIDNYSGAVIHPSGHDPDIVYVGLTDGVVVLQFKNGEWKSMGHIAGVEADIGEMNEDREGNLWLGTFSEGVIRVKFAAPNGTREYKNVSVTRFGVKDGLPLGYVQIHHVKDNLIYRVEPNHTLYSYNGITNRFEPFAWDDVYPRNDSTSIYPFANEYRGQTWMVKRRKGESSFDFHIYSVEHDKTEKDVVPFRRVQEDTDEALFVDDSGIAWLGGLDGIARFDYKSYRQRASDFKTILNEVTVGSDSVVYSGTNTPIGNFNFAYRDNSIKFSFAATTYDLTGENEYQFILDGFDETWSGWTKDFSKSYTQIREGEYEFKVKARNIYGDLSHETTFAFSVDPPWYRHSAAYVGYVFLGAGLVYLIVRIKMSRLEKEKEALEKVVEDRTAKITLQNFQLEQQAEELRTQTEQLKEIDKIKSNFFTNISHEFRTPLSLILAPLERELSGSIKRPEAEMMYRNATRLQTLINQLLDLSKLESGQMKVFLCRNDLTSFFETVLSGFYSLAESKGIRLSATLPDHVVEASFDAEKLETILYNLLSNAIKFTPENGEVSVSFIVNPENQQIEFSVRDTGDGIPEEDLARIFDKFYQVDAGTRREFEGSGIGLALVKELVHLMEGSITVESRPGAGSCFRVALPLPAAEENCISSDLSDPSERPAHLSEMSRAGIIEPEFNMQRSTILLVEDNADMRIYLGSVLEKKYRVVMAINGEEALATTERLVPDLILSDMMMPKMDGFTLCEKIRGTESTSHIPFILLTARSTIESRLAGLELGADDYLTKPFHVAELEIRIKNLLLQRAQLKKRFRQELKIEPKDVTVTSMDEKFLRTVMEAVEQYMGDSTFSVERLSEIVGMSRKNLHRKLVALVDQSPNEFIRVFRLKLALQLLEKKSGNVKEVAFAVGFNNLSYFAKCFKEQFGIAPTEVGIESPLPAMGEEFRNA